MNTQPTTQSVFPIDDYSIYLWLAVLFILLIGIIAKLILTIIKHKHKKVINKVKQFSNLYTSLYDLNNKYHFHTDISEAYELTQVFNSKQGLERANANDIIAYLLFNDSTIQQVYSKLTENRQMYEDYIKEYNAISSTTDEKISESKVKKSRFFEIENKACQEILLNPIRDVTINIYFEYNSPMGKNRYRRSFVSKYSNLNHIFTEIPRRQIIQAQARVERSKMSDALRYEVLKRDGFRCTICGKTANDGVKLHVDHIFPVSKGGKTEVDNLRTLCERCNLGKSDKFDINGLN